MADLFQVEEAEHACETAVKSMDGSAASTQNVLAQLKSVRETVARTIANDIKQASHCLRRSWNLHVQLRAEFKKRLDELRKNNNKPVETRKWVKYYLEFLKEGQRWYRQYIVDVNERDYAFPQLAQITGIPVNGQRNDFQHPLALDTCHRALLCLGDLCRWRAADKLDREINWGPTIGYYDLAIAFKPSSGEAFTKRSLVELSLSNHFKAVHYQYRAVMTAIDDDSASGVDDNSIGNLTLQMGRLVKRWNSPEFSPRSNSLDDESRKKTMTTWFLRLHSLLYQGGSLDDDGQLIREVLSRLDDELRRMRFVSMNNVFTKMALINMAAERTTLVRLQHSSAAEAQARLVSTFGNFQLLNIMFFKRLLDSWVEIRQASVASSGKAMDDHVKSPQDVAASNILPCLRLYSQWLITNSRFLYPVNANGGNRAAASALWSVYAKALATTAVQFPIRALPECPYLLDEELDADRFTPLVPLDGSPTWLRSDGLPKTRPEDADRQTVDWEMLSRVRDLLVDGLKMSKEATPISFEGGSFVLRSAASPRLRHARDMSRKARPTAQPIDEAASTQATNVALTERTAMLPHDDSLDHDARAIAMVDDLVGRDTSPRAQARPASARHHMDAETIRPTRTPADSAQWVPTPPTGGSLSVPGGTKPQTNPHLHNSQMLFGDSVWSIDRVESSGIAVHGQSHVSRR